MSPSSFRKSIFIGVILLLITAYSYSQNLTDQVVEVNRLSNEKQYDKAIQKCKILLKTNGIHNFDLFYLQKTLAGIYSNTDTDSSFVYFSAALETLQIEPFSQERQSAEIFSYSSLGYIQKLRKKYNSSTQYLEKAVILFHTQTEPTLADSTEYLYSVKNLSEILHIGNNQNEIQLENEIVRLSEWSNRYSNYIDNIEHNCIAHYTAQEKPNKKLLNLYNNIFTSTIGYSNVQRIKAKYNHTLLSRNMTNSGLIKEFATYKLTSNDSLEIALYFRDIEDNNFVNNCSIYTNNYISYNYLSRTPTSKNILSLGINLYHLNSLENCDQVRNTEYFKTEFLQLARAILNSGKYDSIYTHILKYYCWISNEYSIASLSKLNSYQNELKNKYDSIAYYELKSQIEKKNQLLMNSKISDEILLEVYLNITNKTKRDSSAIHFLYDNISSYYNGLQKITLLNKSLEFINSIDKISSCNDSLETYIRIAGTYTSINDYNQATKYYNIANNLSPKITDPNTIFLLYKSQQTYYQAYKNYQDHNEILKKINNHSCIGSECDSVKEILKIDYEINKCVIEENFNKAIYYERLMYSKIKSLSHQTIINEKVHYYYKIQSYFLSMRNDSCKLYIDSIEIAITNDKKLNTKQNQLTLLNANASYYRIFGFYDDHITTLSNKHNFIAKEFGKNSNEYFKSLLFLHDAYHSNSTDANELKKIEMEMEAFSFDMYICEDMYLIDQFLKYKSRILETQISNKIYSETWNTFNLIKTISSSALYKNNKNIIANGVSELIIKMLSPQNQLTYDPKLINEENIKFWSKLINDIKNERNKNIGQKRFLMNLGNVFAFSGLPELASEFYSQYNKITTYSPETDQNFNFHYALNYKQIDSLDRAIFQMEQSIESKKKYNQGIFNNSQLPKENSYGDHIVLFKWLKEMNKMPSAECIRSYLNSNYYRYFNDDTNLRKSIIGYNLMSNSNDNITSYYLNYKSNKRLIDPIENIQHNLSHNEIILLFDIAYYHQNFEPFVITISNDDLTFTYLNENPSKNNVQLNNLFEENHSNQTTEYNIIFSGGTPLFNLRSSLNIDPEIKISYLDALSSLDHENYAYPIRSNEVYLLGNPSFSNQIEDNKSNFAALSNISTSRGAIEESNWTQLPQTELEIVAIKDILSNHNYNVNTFNQAESSEKNLRMIEYPEILHIATHGFYMNMDSTSIKPGIVLSNANESHELNIHDKNDGYLFPDDLKDIPLTCTKLVVLSACDSGKKDIYEVYSDFTKVLFNKGVENIIVTLDIIDDDATRDFMSTYYSYLVQLNNVRLAFDKTEQYMKVKYVDPKYWNNFILISKYLDTSLF